MPTLINSFIKVSTFPITGRTLMTSVVTPLAFFFHYPLYEDYDENVQFTLWKYVLFCLKTYFHRSFLIWNLLQSPWSCQGQSRRSIFVLQDYFLLMESFIRDDPLKTYLKFDLGKGKAFLWLKKLCCTLCLLQNGFDFNL